MIQLPMKKWGKKEVTDWNRVSEGSIYIVDGEVVEVMKNEMVTKVSKTGKVRKERRITSRIVGHTEELESGSDSFKLGRFIKKLKQLTYKIKEKAKKVAKKVKEAFKGTFLPVKLEDVRYIDFWGTITDEFHAIMMKDFTRATCEGLKEIKKVYRKWAARLHPDKGLHDSWSFEVLQLRYEVAKLERKRFVDNCREAGIEMEY